MKVLFAASECVPYAKTGGLADVAGTLPQTLCKQGEDIRVILPKYKHIPDQWKQSMQHVLTFEVRLGWRRQFCGLEMLEKDGVKYYFVDNEYYFARDTLYSSGEEDAERFSFFCRAVLEAMPLLDFMPDILHCNDWHTGMIIALLETQYRKLPAYADIRTVFTIHNLQYQGIFDWMHTDDLLSLGKGLFAPEYLEFFGKVSFMKGGLVFADKITTVSPSYAKEIRFPEYGERLDGLLRSREDALVGILNGIDNLQYDPGADPYLPAHYTLNDLSGKAECKRQLQDDMGLEIRSDVPLIGMVTRLAQQKGMDLVERVLEDIMNLDVQMVIIGSGERRYEDLLRWASWRYQGRFADYVGYSDKLAHRIYAGSDIFLMPSRFEPCGLSQMIALRYGTIPLVRETGGLKDTVLPYNRYTDEGNGFSFMHYNAEDMLVTLKLALQCYGDEQLWDWLIVRAMRSDYSWDHSAKEYHALYMGLMRERGRSVPEEPVTIKKLKTVKKTFEEEPRTVKKSKAAGESKTEHDPESKIMRKTKNASKKPDTGRPEE